MGLFGSKKVIGLDVGTNTVKVAELNFTKKSATLLNFAMYPTPETAVSGGDILDPGQISEVIGAVVTELKSRRKSVAAGLWGASVVVKKISIPKMEESLVAEQLKWEAEQYIPFELSEVNLDYHILKSFDSSSDSMDVLLVAARHDKVLSMMEMVEGAQLKCGLLDVQGFALANCFRRSQAGMSSGLVGVVNIGASFTNFIVLQDEELVFCRDIPTGGSVYTSEIKRAMGVSFSEAEVLKVSACSGGDAPDDVLNVIESTHENVIDEIQGSYDFFLNTTPGASLKHLLVTGGASLTSNLINRLQKSLNVECSVFNPFANITAKKKISEEYKNQIYPFAAVAMGLGLREEGE